MFTPPSPLDRDTLSTKVNRTEQHITKSVQRNNIHQSLCEGTTYIYLCDIVPLMLRLPSQQAMAWSKKEVVVLLLLLGVVGIGHGNDPPSTPCEDDFHDSNSCPQFEDGYNKINELCCSDKAGELHCISTATGSPGGLTRAIYGCFNVTDIPPGFGMSLEPKNSPKEIRLVPCEGPYYEPDSRSSKDVRHDYCTHPKTKCSGSGQIRICKGGPAADDLCSCADDYEPTSKDCWKGFDHDDSCQCQPKTCQPGTARNVTGAIPETCPNNRTVPLDYTCHLAPSSAASSPEPPTESTPPASSTADDGPNLLWLWILLPVSISVIGICI